MNRNTPDFDVDPSKNSNDTRGYLLFDTFANNQQQGFNSPEILTNNKVKCFNIIEF